MGVATVTQLCLPGHPPCNRITAELGMRGAAGELEGIQEGAALRDYSSCVHGLGHGLMMHAQGDRADGFGGARMNDASLVSHADLLGERAALTRALSVCNAGPRPSESCQCASGVYMQVTRSAASPCHMRRAKFAYHTIVRLAIFWRVYVEAARKLARGLRGPAWFREGDEKGLALLVDDLQCGITLSLRVPSKSRHR